MNAHELALLAVEARLRGTVVDLLETGMDPTAALLAAAITDDNPGSGSELLSRPDVHEALTGMLAGIRAQAETAINAGYLAAAQTARAHTGRALKRLGHEPAASVTGVGDAVRNITEDLDTAVADALIDIHNRIRAGYDGVTGDPQAAGAARVLTTNAALRAALGRLRLRVNSAAATAVQRGARDIELALFDDYAAANPYTRVRKRWVTGGDDPCPMCEALNGTEADLGDEFDRAATTDPDTRVRPVWRDLQGPPRHPNCRCHLELATTNNR